MTSGVKLAAMVLAALVLLATSLEAQRVVISYIPADFTATTDVLNLATGALESREPTISSWPVFTSDGRFLLTRSSPSPFTPSVLELRDLVTGLRTVISQNFEPRRAHPARYSVYGISSGALARLDGTGLRAYTACGTAVRDVALTTDGSRLLALCNSGDVESVDEASGSRLAVVATGGVAAGGFAINADGSQIVIARDAAGGGTELVRFDVATGIELFAAPVSGEPPPAPYSGPGSSRIVGITLNHDAVLVTTTWMFVNFPFPNFHYRTQLLELETFAPLRRLPVRFDPLALALLRDGRRALIASAGFRNLGAFQDVDLETGEEKAIVQVRNTFALAAAFPPLSPTLPPATVNSQRVTITWSLPTHSPPAIRFVIHAGSRSGASDLGTIDLGGNTTSFTANAVPPGRYFIRMTAVNFTGTSTPSSELIVDVP